MHGTTEITIVIPTHNPRLPVLAQVLAHIRAQSLPRTCWNAILVDNASEPPVDEAFCKTQLPGLTLVREPRTGLLFARLAGIAAVTADIVVFVDDDNLLAPDYLEQVLSFLRQHPNIGAIGGRIHGEFAVPPPNWARDHVGSLAVRDLGAEYLISSHDGFVTMYDYFAPFGAGMAVRTRCCRDFASAAQRGEIKAIGRQGTHLGGSEDCELVMTVWRAGLECAYVPSLQLRHIIPETRLRFRYLQRLARQGQESWAHFLCRSGLARRIPRWTVPLRQLKAFFRHRAWTRSGFIKWRGVCGYFAGLASKLPRESASGGTVHTGI